MSAPGTYIYCTRFHETKSILICAIRCPYWHGCKDWAAALAGNLKDQIQLEANEYAARKGITINPEVWDPLQPKKRKRPQPQPGNGQSGLSARDSGSGETRQSRIPNPAQVVASPAETRSHRKIIQTPKRSSRLETQTMAIEEAMTKEAATKTVTPKRRAAKPAGSAKKTKKPGTSNGTVFLILDRNGRYREVKSEEEMKRIAIESAGKGKKGIRFARATVLEVEVTFRPLR